MKTADYHNYALQNQQPVHFGGPPYLCNMASYSLLSLDINILFLLTLFHIIFLISDVSLAN